MTFFQPGQRAYCQAVGTSNTSNLVIFQRDPTSNDTSYSIGQFWQNQSLENLWYLNALTSFDGLLQAHWVLIATASVLVSLSGSNTPDTPVFASTTSSPLKDNIQLTNLDGSMTITSSPSNNQIIFTATPGASLLPWSNQSSSFNAVVDNGYFTTGTLTATLPASPTRGQVVAIAVDTTSTTIIRANTGQYIRIGDLSSTSNGTATNTFKGDSVNLVYSDSSSTWYSTATQGNWALA